MSRQKAVLIRVDGGKVWGISFGHLKRSLLLAERLSAQYRIVFFMKDYSDGVSLVREKGFQVETLAVHDDSDGSLTSFCRRYHPDLCLFDLHTLPYLDFFDFARTEKILTVVLDILGRCRCQPDILINDSLVPDFTDYSSLNGKTRVFLGPDYFVMNSFKEIISPKPQISKILLTCGGSDPAGLTLKILPHLVQTEMALQVGCVLGPGFNQRQEVNRWAGGSNPLTVYVTPPDLMGLMSQQDVVISAAGRTLYECAHLGRPVVIVPSIDHEAKTAVEFALRTGCLNIGPWNDLQSPLLIIKAVRRYREDFELRKNVFQTGRNLVDGKGLERVMKIINLCKDSSDAAR